MIYRYLHKIVKPINFVNKYSDLIDKFYLGAARPVLHNIQVPLAMHAL